jgi:hypothetical protein
MEGKNNHNYTSADFERYHSGKMNEQEMYAIEKAAMEDPFLADALDGYVHTDSIAQDVAELRQRLAKREQKKVIFLGYERKQWLKVAAMVVLIAGAGYFTYILNNDQITDKDLALEKQRYKAPETTIALPADSIPANNHDVAINDQPKKSAENTIAKPSDILKDRIASAPVTKAESTEKTDDFVANKTRKEAATYFLEGKVKDIYGNDVPFANIKADNAVVNADATGKFKLPANDSISVATISAAHYNTRQSFLNSNMNQMIILEPGNKALEEVVVTGMRMARRDKNVAAATKKVTAKEISAPPASPSQILDPGTDSSLVLKSIEPIYENGVQYTGEVILSFIASKKGKPGKIKIERSLCKACDEAARRLLNAQKFKYENGRRSILKIRF